MGGPETNQLVVLVGGVIGGWAGWTGASDTTPILGGFSAPVLGPAPGLSSTPGLGSCLGGDVSGGNAMEGEKRADFFACWGGEGSNGEGEEEGDGEFEAEHGGDWRTEGRG